MARTALHGIGGLLAALSAIFILAVAVPGCASAEIGSGSRLAVETQTQMLNLQGGGYMTWELSGQVVNDIRRNLDERFGNGDGNVSEAEASAYTGEIDLMLENFISYGSARIVRTSLLNKNIQTDTDGLMAPVNSSRDIKIHFTFNANLRTDSSTVNFGDTTIPLVVFRALKDDRNQTFAGTLEWKHTEIVVGLSSFSNVALDRGSLTHFRAPGMEVLVYQLSVTGNASSSDQVRFDTFNVVQCSAELFIVTCVFGVMTIWFPRYFMKKNKMKKVRWLHYLPLLLVTILLLVFFLGVDGAAAWALAPLFAVLSGALSWQVYKRKWRNMAQPLLPPLAPRQPAPQAEVENGTELSEPAVAMQQPSSGTGPGEFPAPVQRKMPPKPPGPAVPSPPLRTLRCPKCKATFEVPDSGQRPLPIKCTSCGTEGVLRK